MDGWRVSELADRAGVPASTVRYDDTEGLLPARRSASGYALEVRAPAEALVLVHELFGEPDAFRPGPAPGR
ncbi:MerR family transcriptional regulator [Actinomycetospora flava]|uniref:MerR family transcriptional regulator n=1 Tax=Actinomycetospora flava TaxID=3129232 RepID=A0ABU8M8S3_9PSEU